MDLISQESPKAAFGVAVERFKRQKVLLPKPPSQVEGVKLRDGHLGCQGCSTMFLQLQECLGFVFFFQMCCPSHPNLKIPAAIEVYKNMRLPQLGHLLEVGQLLGFYYLMIAVFMPSKIVVDG